MNLSRLLILTFISSSLLLQACGGGSGGSTSPSSSSSVSLTSSIASSVSSSSQSSDCQYQTGAQHLKCYQGQYNVTAQYAGAAQAWSQITITDDGQVIFSGAEEFSFTADDISELVIDGSIITVQLNRTQAPTHFIFFSDGNGQLRDIEYHIDNKLIGIGLAARVALPTWVQNPNTLINNGIAGSLDNRLFLLYHDPAAQTAYADERGLLFNGENESGDSWTIQIDTVNLEKNVDYLCYQGDKTISITLMVNGEARYSSLQAGQCRIQLTTIEWLADKQQIDYIDGIFVAELPIADHNTRPIIIDGRFRFDVN